LDITIYFSKINNQHQHSRPKDDVVSCSQEQKPPTSRPTKSRGHRRQRAEIASTENFLKMVMLFDQKRRRRNHALDAKDFDEKILEDLFPAN
jgi:hypothetical protein